MKRFLILLMAAVLAAMHAAPDCSAQKIGVSTNIIDWCNYGTLNAGVSVSAGQHLTAGVSARYNPWFFAGGTERQVNHAVRSVSLDLRYWTWHVYSGWWFMLKGQLQEFNYGNIHGMKFSEQGRARGAGIGAGYALMTGTHWNLDFGLSFWGGVREWRRYDCSYCGSPLKSGKGFFILPDNVFVSLCYIF
jgi:hypothetical protein